MGLQHCLAMVGGLITPRRVCTLRCAARRRRAGIVIRRCRTRPSAAANGRTAATAAADGRRRRTFCIPILLLALTRRLAFLPRACVAVSRSTIMGNYTPNYDTKRYLINASLIVCGIMTLVQSYGVQHPRLPFQLGAGVLSVMGVSFTSLPIGQVIIPALRNDWYVDNPQCTTALQNANCAITSVCLEFPSTIPSCAATCPAAAYHCQSDSFDHAWGLFVGTSCFCACIPFFISLLSFKKINQLFPPIVVGPTIMLIGIALINAGIGYWGGGAFHSCVVSGSYVSGHVGS
jgi:xanthine/uracil permease